MLLPTEACIFKMKIRPHYTGKTLGRSAYITWPHPHSKLFLPWRQRQHFSLKLWYPLTRLYPAYDSAYHDLNYDFCFTHSSPSSHFFLFLVSKYHHLLFFLLCNDISVQRELIPQKLSFKPSLSSSNGVCIFRTKSESQCHLINLGPMRARKTENHSPVRIM